MFDFFKEIMSGSYDKRTAESENKLVQIATCALFLEMAKADDNFAQEEKEQIIDIMKESFGLGEEEVEEIIRISEDRVNKSVSLFEFTEILNKHLDNEQKYDIVKNLWRLIYADNELSKYEEHLIRLITNNFNLAHKDMIAAKMEVKAELNK